RKYVKKPDGSSVYELRGQTQPYLKGAGRGKMIISNVQLKETTDAIEKPVAVGDFVVLDDPELEPARGQWLGRVEKIEPARLFAIIIVSPIDNLSALTEVMVMNKTPAAP